MMVVEPLSLNEPVGFRFSSLKYVLFENLTSGVQPSPNVTISVSFMYGKNFAYRHAL